MLIGRLKGFHRQILLAFALIIVVSAYLFFRESTFQECVLNHVKDASNDSAALVYRMCKEKYPDKPKNHNNFELSQNQLAELTGRAGQKYEGSSLYSVNLYNGNQDLTVSEITISVTTKSKKSESESREYKKSVSIAPKSAGDFSFEFIVGEQGSSYSWHIVSARGYKD